MTDDIRTLRARQSRDRRRWVRRYPPMVSLLVALLITVLVLPSALTLPNANPSTVLEYAPVPPEKDEPPPPQQGNISSLGLGVSSSIAVGSEPGLPSVQLPGGKGTKPITKRCVGRPLRQTEDPNSPPCVPFFEGENGGKTWQGITKDEVVVLVYTSLVINALGDEAYEEPPNDGSYCDVDGPPDSDPNCLEGSRGLKDHFEVRQVRALSRFFNERFQTYGRHIHFWIYYSGSNTPAGRRADAADNWERLKPFAVIDDAPFGGNNAVYAESMVRRNSAVFGNFTALANAYYKQYAPFIWSFWPDIEHWAEQYASYLCQKVFPFPTVSHAGGGLVGRPRRHGLLYADDPLYPGLKQFADLVKKHISQCPNGAKPNIVESRSFPRHQYANDTHPDAPTAARQNIAAFSAAGVTSILWLGGYEAEHTKAAAAANYLPEWFIGGDLLNDQIEESRGQDQRAFRYARLATNQLREDREQDAPCRQAFREAEPNGNRSDEASVCGGLYRSFFQLFTSIQVAGPELTPYSVDRGQHAIQRQSSPTPYVAACFYDPGDYTCVKDMQEAWWDADAPDPDGDTNERGCWRQVRDGVRFLPGTWQGTDKDVFSNGANDPCNTVGDNNTYVNPYGPAG